MSLTFKKKYIKTALAVIWWLVVSAVVLIAVIVLKAKFCGEVPKLFGYSVMKVVSGSMEPEIPTGTYIFVKECDAEEIKKGDIISFYSTDTVIYGRPNTHRVVEEPVMTENGPEFVTKGDANAVSDADTVAFDKVIGKYVAKADLLTGFSEMLEGGLMVVILAVLPVGIIAVMILTALKKRDASEPEEAEKRDD